MIVFCEECGGKYRVDPSKIKGKEAKGKCRSCGHVITITKTIMKSTEQGHEEVIEETSTLKAEEKPHESRMSMLFSRKARRVGLTTKFMFFILMPLIIIYGISVFFSMKNISSFHDLTLEKSTNLITRMTEQKTNSYSRLLALQVKNFLLEHPELKKEDFNKNEDFKKVVLRRVGRTGYTVLYEVPDGKGIWRAWIHPNPNLTGTDLSLLKNTLGENFHGFWKTLTGVKNGKESNGYYAWRERDGRIRDKYMACVPVDGTPYIVGSTLYLDELNAPIKRLEKEAQLLVGKAKRANMAIMGAGLVALALIIFFYGRSLTGKIKRLSETADRISVGELDAEIEIKSNDEIEDLAEAVSRMQDSIRLSIERLRGRRAKNAA